MTEHKMPNPGPQPTKRWCKYCYLMTRPDPAHAGRPTACSVCHRPYDAHATPPPELITDTRPPSANGVGAASSLASPDRPMLPAPCFHLRDRNNPQTVHLEPHRCNACYARLRLRRRWLRPDMSVEPTRVSKVHQTQYCFANYTACPFFLPAGTPPEWLAEDD